MVLVWHADDVIGLRRREPHFRSEKYFFKPKGALSLPLIIVARVVYLLFLFAGALHLSGLCTLKYMKKKNSFCEKCRPYGDEPSPWPTAVGTKSIKILISQKRRMDFFFFGNPFPAP